MDFRPIKTKKIYEEIIDQIKELIREGELNPGDKLISERELAEKLRVGRSAVREAFRALEVMGLIEIRPGEGTFIREASMENILESLALVLSMERNTAREIMEVRKILELETATLAAERRTQEEILRMEEALKEMEEDIKTGDVGEQADVKFHFAIAEATHNTILVRLMNAISDVMRQAVRANREKYYLTPGTPQRLLQEHYRVYEAIRAGNPQLAREMMNEHLVRVEREILEIGV